MKRAITHSTYPCSLSVLSVFPPLRGGGRVREVAVSDARRTPHSRKPTNLLHSHTPNTRADTRWKNVMFFPPSFT
jgi:hypothetical protein